LENVKINLAMKNQMTTFEILLIVLIVLAVPNKKGKRNNDYN